MELFLQVALSFPTVLFSIMFCLVLIYWLAVALGGVEVDLLDVSMDSSLDGAGQVEGVAGLLSKLKLNDVPVTVVVTLLTLIGWLISYLVEVWLLQYLPLGVLRFPLGLIVTLGALVLAVPVCATICRPLRPLFRKAEATSSKTVLGQVALVRSGKVTLQHGEAVLEDGGAGLILRVRADEAQGFKRGDRVVLLEYLATEHAYRVISENEFRGV
ncbi:hypothetical protein DFO61_2760 [Ectopseudomonas oleovorans]|uniref:DUF1449 family protein n=2 Tax=Ectopseudomonas TaxID=3236654 RepID=A0A397N3X2_ECTOL|nr:MULTISPECIES: hypothetical protein [Pseudomonas aeruginosa group]AVO52004.1 hypothetical protein C7A17_04225 [Pseudomonas mendocina]RIA32030.1 hypothetical protein DFO61_2760 [Pseudomonas oleovorans]